MAAQNGFGQIEHPRTLQEAIVSISDGAVPVAGATWIMRAPIRHELLPVRLVDLRDIEDLHVLAVGSNRATLGAMTTHASLARALAPHADLHGLATAAGTSANPGIRKLATLGGNIGTPAFAASDLAPALLALDAEVVLATGSGVKTVPMDAFLSARDGFMNCGLIVRIEITRSSRHAAHMRLPMRKAGDYPCAVVSVSADLSGGKIADIRIAVGAVEATARRWTSLEERLTGTAFDPALAEAAARRLTQEFIARDAVDAPGWYRLSVLPVLLRRAVTKLQAEV